jgi:hypothetical protein
MAILRTQAHVRAEDVEDKQMTVDLTPESDTHHKFLKDPDIYEDTGFRPGGAMTAPGYECDSKAKWFKHWHGGMGGFRM